MFTHKTRHHTVFPKSHREFSFHAVWTIESSMQNCCRVLLVQRQSREEVQAGQGDGGQERSRTFSKVRDALGRVASAIIWAVLVVPMRTVEAPHGGSCWGEGETTNSTM